MRATKSYQEWEKPTKKPEFAERDLKNNNSILTVKLVLSETYSVTLPMNGLPSQFQLILTAFYWKTETLSHANTEELPIQHSLLYEK